MPDPDALLCERCGYSIAGLREDEACPECGQAAGLSWPRQRPGSTYQRRRNPAGRWFWANVEVLRSPARLFRRVRIESGTSAGLLGANLMIASGFVTVGFFSANHQWFTATLGAYVISFGVLLLLTYVETLGLRFFSRAESRRWRVTRQVAWTVCNHASVGWLIGGLLMLGVLLTDPAGRLCASQWANDRCRDLTGASFNDRYELLRMAQVMTPPILGVIAFETLVYIGVRRCRYANTPASASQQGAPAGASNPPPDAGWGSA
jgi:hypothetical protein